MTVLLTIVAIIVVVGALAVWYDQRAKRRGRRSPAVRAAQTRSSRAGRGNGEST